MAMTEQQTTGELELDSERVAEMLTGELEPQLIDVRELPAEAASIERDRPVVFYCRTGSRSLMAAQAFSAAGYEAYSMAGGLVRWVSEGRPLAPEGGSVADH
jgi:rhodanese-related sulfurtransferase